MRLRLFTALQHSIARDGFSPGIHDALRAEMRADRMGKSPAHVDAARRGHADRRAKERARVIATMHGLRRGLGLPEVQL